MKDIFREIFKRKFSQVECALVVLLRRDHLVEESPTSLHRGGTEGQQQAVSSSFEQFQTVLSSLKQFQTVSNSFKQFRAVSNSFKQFQTVSSSLNQFQARDLPAC